MYSRRTGDARSGSSIRQSESRGRRPYESNNTETYGQQTHTNSLGEGRRKTLWSGEPTRYKKVLDKNLDTIIVGSLTSEQVNAYQTYFRIEEIADVLRVSHQQQIDLLSLLPSGDIKNSHLKRDPSPPPKYDSYGNRVNTREIRTRENLEKEMNYLVEFASGSIKHYNPPYDYQKPIKTLEKIFIPVKDYPDINFVGFILGPRATTLKKIEADSGATLAIRGKGSVKDGRVHQSDDTQEEDLHVVITADNLQKLAKGIQLTNEIIEKLVSSPIGQNELKREQLKQLAIYNGTLRETTPFDPNKYTKKGPSFDITRIVCKVCGNVGHLARDCKYKNARNDTVEETPDDSSIKRQKVDNALPPWAQVTDENNDFVNVSHQTPVPFENEHSLELANPTSAISEKPPPPSIIKPPPAVAIKPPPPNVVKPPPPQIKPPPVSQIKPPPPSAKPPPPHPN